MGEKGVYNRANEGVCDNGTRAGNCGETALVGWVWREI